MGPLYVFILLDQLGYLDNDIISVSSTCSYLRKRFYHKYIRHWINKSAWKCHATDICTTYWMEFNDTRGPVDVPSHIRCFKSALENLECYYCRRIDDYQFSDYEKKEQYYFFPHSRECTCKIEFDPFYLSQSIARCREICKRKGYTCYVDYKRTGKVVIDLYPHEYDDDGYELDYAEELSLKFFNSI